MCAFPLVDGLVLTALCHPQKTDISFRFMGRLITSVFSLPSNTKFLKMKNFNSLAKYILKNEPFRSPAFVRKSFVWFIFLGVCVLQPQYLSAQCSVAFTQCPSSISIMDCDHSGNEAIQWPLVIANTSGFCTGYTITQTLGPAAGTLVPLGTYSIGYTAQVQDLFSGAISTATCNFSVSVIADPTPPTFVNCPPNITVFGIDNGSGTCNAQAYWTNPTASDPCGNTVITASGTPCGTSFPMGANTVTYTVTDESNNSATCSFTVTVICIVGTSEAGKNLFPIRILPNPNPGTFTVEMSEAATPGIKFRILDLTGRLVQEQKTEPGSAQQTVRAGELPSGLYFLQVVSDGKVLAVEKFVKQ